jgi:hypothetical protein
VTFSPVFAVTLHEPWATLMMVANPEDRKKIETRDWEPVVGERPYRGPLVIHAGKKLDRHACYDEPFDSVLARHFGTRDYVSRFKLGHILGTVELLHVATTDLLLHSVGDTEAAFGDYYPGRFGWITDYAIPLPNPIPARGMQKLWRITPEQHAEIMRQTPAAGLGALA